MTDTPHTNGLRADLRLSGSQKAVLAILTILAAFGVSYIIDKITVVRRTMAQSATAVPQKSMTASMGARARGIRPERIEYLSGTQLRDEMRKGGLVLFMRHFQTDHRKWHVDPVKDAHLEMSIEDFQKSCDEQRPLSEYGKMRAKLTGEGMRALGIHIGTSLASPYCRVVEGSRLLTGKDPELTKDLLHRGGAYTAEMMIEKTIPLLSTPPMPGTNTLLMSHRPQMDDISFIEEGQMFVFRPMGSNRFDLIGAIYDTEWVEAQVDPDLLGARFPRAVLAGADLRPPNK
jgi:phosphohistidine phosphatase SixA